jgi:hypothetical protein
MRTNAMTAALVAADGSDDGAVRVWVGQVKRNICSDRYIRVFGRQL